jgi:alkanesulfonate monooxygenase SsuD/methylene tetrahydromethanopterin reductase-like flavin-dependent oxidoreductase (luciferase family)
MKVSVFQQAPYRFLPADFQERYESSVLTTPYEELVDTGRLYDSYRWFMDELLHALRAGFDGVAVTEHGQTSYDMCPNPNLAAAVLGNAIRQEERDAALIVLGRSLGKTREPLRIAEEYAMLDCLSGGRLVAGLPVGLSYDANLCNGIAPIETRGRYRESHDLMIKSWTAHEPFPWNGVYSQYALVNSWPRPLQKPHPPIWVPGAGTPGTMAWTLERGYAFCYLSWFGATLTAHRIFDRFWEIAEQHGSPPNPYRVSFVQSVVVSETDERVEQEYGSYVESAFRQGPGSVPLHYMGLPGYVDIRGVQAMLQDPGDFGLAAQMRHATFRELAETRAVIAGSPATVGDQIVEFVEKFRIGNLLVMLQMGGMPHELTLRNIDLFAEQVLPRLRQVWSDESWEHEWWPTGIAEAAPSAETVGA